MSTVYKGYLIEQNQYGYYRCTDPNVNGVCYTLELCKLAIDEHIERNKK